MGQAYRFRDLHPKPPLRGRLLRAVSVVLGLIGFITFVTVPMNAEQQMVLSLAGIGFYLLIDRFDPSRRASLVLVVMSVVVTARYLFWRFTETLVFEEFWQGIFAFGLFAAETYAGCLLSLSYLQTAYPLDRKPVPLPADSTDWPTVDVYICSYNEALELVRPTVFAAMAMDWPADKLNVWILDDGRREDFREFAGECGCGYIIRPDNKGAKAGNLNHAMRHTKGEFIAIFDCDHAPTRSFLQLSLGWLVRDDRIALVQTPHHFYSPDPFERNLAQKRQVPNEGLLFYGLTQQGNDMWNAAFFCGSCAVIRRTALEEIGGVPSQTVTEDCHCAFLLQQRGWHTAFLRLPMAAGLATERLALHVGQRMRWARGMLQIMRQENTLFAPGLLLHQRLCYFTSGFSFLFSLPRIVFLTSPLAFLFFGQSVIAASPLAIVAYAGSHMFHSVATTSRLNGSNRHSFWAEIYEASLAVPLLPVTILTLWDPRKGKFNVTDKGGTLEHGYLDTRAVTPNLVLLGLLLIGVGIGFYGIATTEGREFQAYLLNTIWGAMCLIPVSASIAVGREREQSRSHARAEADVAVDLHLRTGVRIQARTIDLSLSGARLAIDRPLGLADGDPVEVVFHTCGDDIALHATMLHWEGKDAFLSFRADTLAEQEAVARLFFSRPDAWLHWDHWPEDRPLRALADVVMATAGAVFRSYRFGSIKNATRVAPVKQAPRVSDVIAPRKDVRPALREMARVGGVLSLLLAGATSGNAQSVPPNGPLISAQAGSPGTPELPLPPGARDVRITLRDLGVRGPLKMGGMGDLQGVLFGLKADEVVTSARLNVFGASSPSLIASLSQVAITLNEQAVGTIALDPTRQSFGPIGFDLDPLFFAELNRLNFRFSGRYAIECNDAMSGLLWATISDLSTISMRIERLPQQRDLAKLPEPLFDRRQLRGALTLNFVVPDSAGSAALRAAAIAASWFAVQAEDRGASFPVSRTLPQAGNAVVLASGAEVQTYLPRIEGPTVALVANPTDPFGTLLVIAGRTEQELAAAALALATGKAGFSGQISSALSAQPTPRKPYDAPRWLATGGAVAFGTLVDKSELQSSGYAPGPIRIPLRTAPDLLTWRNVGLPAVIRYRSPPAPIADAAFSRLDVSLSDTYLRSLPLREGEHWWPIEWVLQRLTPWFGAPSEVQTGRVSLPPYLLFGHEELQLRFDMRPQLHGECAGAPGDIRAAVDPDSTVDISHAYRFAQMPNVGLFASAGFPFTRLADLSDTAAILPERPSPAETGVFLDTIGFLAAVVGLPATGLVVAMPAGLSSVANRDLLVFGAVGRQPALPILLRDSAIQVSGGRLTASLPDRLQDIRAALLSNQPDIAERSRVVVGLNETGAGMGIIVGLQSPLQAGRSVVVLTGLDQSGMTEMAAALRDPEQSGKIQGDVSILNGGRISAFRANPPYEIGDIPLWLRAQLLIGGRPERAGVVLLATASLIGIPFFWMLRRRAAMRLRARSKSS